MAVQGSTFGVMNLHDLGKRVIRHEGNPLDKSTVVSILPKPICEIKPTIFPGVFKFEPGSIEKPSVLVVTSSSWWRDLDPEQPAIEIPTSSVNVANSIITDYSNGLIGFTKDISQPGLFWVLGEHTVESIKKDHKAQLEHADALQKAWYRELIKIADILWARSNGNPLSISNDARLACKELGIKNKPWLGDLIAAELSNCPACGSMRNAAFPICPNCKTIIDKAKFAALGLQQAV